MYNDPNNFDVKPTTMPMFPRCPDYDDPRWCEVAVRSRTQSQTNIKRIPLDTDGTEIATIFIGDTIAIVPEVKHKYYVAARIGYHVGWVNFKHVKLVSLAPRNRRLEETKPQPPVNHQQGIARQYEEQQQYEAQQYESNDRYGEQQAYQAEHHNHHDQYVEEDETHPAPIFAARKPPPIPKKDVHRIIDKLKSLGSLFSRR